VVTTVDGQEVRADISGILRGMIRSGILVPAGVKIGDVDPRPDSSHCRLVSDNALAIADGLLEAMLSATAKTRLAYR
jgi:xanthine dehydrogenase accessory factor